MDHLVKIGLIIRDDAVVNQLTSVLNPDGLFEYISYPSVNEALEKQACIRNAFILIDQRRDSTDDELLKSLSALVPLVMITRDPDMVVCDAISDIIEWRNLTPDILKAKVASIARWQNAVDKLREDNHRYALAVTGARYAIWDWDLTADSIYYSPQWDTMFEYQGEHFLDAPDDWFSLVLSEDLEGLTQAFEDHRAGYSAGITHKFRMRNRMGDVLWVRVQGKAVYDQNGEATRIAGTLNDITSRVRANEALQEREEQLIQSQKMDAIGRLAGGISHDFNNLLTVIIANSDLMLTMMNEDHEMYCEVEEIRKASNRAADLIRQLLAFSRKQIMLTQVINANPVINDIDKMLRRLIPEDITLKLELSEDNTFIKIDPSHLEQILMNLVVNARDAITHKEGEIIIETKPVQLDLPIIHGEEVKPGNYIMIAVSDNGTGIPDDTIERIYEPFFTTKDVGKGTGLGLATVYGLVRQSEGHIWVYTEHGKGTVFRLYFPETDELGGEQERLDQARPLPVGTETVLVVEDQEEVRDIIVKALRSKGYFVLQAANGDDALKLAGSYDCIDLVITDIIMPKMGGHVLATHIHKKNPDAKLIFISGYSEHVMLKDEVIQSGEAFLTKPFSITELLTTVRDVLDLKTL